MTKNLLELASCYPEVTISVKAEDLLKATRQLFSEELKKLVAKTPRKPRLVDRKYTMRKLNVCYSTLFKYQNLGMLTPIRKGNKVTYRQSEVNAIFCKRTGRSK